MQLADKYNISVPRYTSYPTVPHWKEENVNQKDWLETVKKSYQETKVNGGIALYIHLPFCESLCTYCGCNKRITKNHSVEESYIESLLAEWDIYANYVGEKIKISEIHLGGGTPTFFSSANLQILMNALAEKAEILSEADLSFEGHPNNTTFEHLMILSNAGFRRVSFGIQDFDEKVQKAIHRIQPLENVERVYEQSKILNYKSINFDLVYGLPFQTLDSLTNTIAKIKDFMPDRIALYSYAHVPWKSPSQRGYNETDLPDPRIKQKMAEMAREMLLDMGYVEIGMDHYALPSDDLSQAMMLGELNRNFMGYTTTNAQLLIGLGCSSISDSNYAFVQNEKHVEAYQEAIKEGKIPLIKGNFNSETDIENRKLIKELICNGRVDLGNQIQMMQQEKTQMLEEMIADGLVNIDNNNLSLTKEGKPFSRIVCMLFDPYIPLKSENNLQFSKAI